MKPFIQSRKQKYVSKSSIYHSSLNQQYGVINSYDLVNTTKSSKEIIQRLKRSAVLEGHSGCVNTISWNESGNLLLSGSDDYHLNIYDVYKQNDFIHSIETGHRANIFSAKFLPCTSDMKIVSCSGDGMLCYNELGSEYGQNIFNCHSGTTYEVLVTPGDPNTFLSCGEDGTVRMFDLRIKNKCNCHTCLEDVLLDIRHAVTSVSVNPLQPYEIAAGCKDKFVRVFDRRTLGTSYSTRSVNKNCEWMPGEFCRFKPENIKKEFSCRVTSLKYSNNGEELLVSYCADYVYTFIVKDKTGTVLDLSNNTVDAQNNGSDKTRKNTNSDETLPPVKRLRLRGDWSDTGPTARPESEERNTSEHNLMQRMSDLFSQWFEDAISSDVQTVSSSSEQSEEEDNSNQETSNQNRTQQGNVNNSLNLAVNIAEGNTDFIPYTNRQNNDDELNRPLINNNNVETTLNVSSTNQSSNTSRTNDLQINETSVSMHVNETTPLLSGSTSSPIEDVEQNSSDSMETSSSNSQINAEIETLASLRSNSNVYANVYDSVETYNAMERASAALKIQRFLRLRRHHTHKSTYNNNHVSNHSTSNFMYLPKTSQCFKGHRNSRTMIKEANYWGDDFILSGSDCGRIFVWDKHTGECVMLLQGDRHVVNCVQPHPYDPILATSGIDHNIKLWAPLSAEAADLSEVNNIIERNEQMLEESRDTITVPASLVLRMLASFGNMRGLRRQEESSRSNTTEVNDVVTEQVNDDEEEEESEEESDI